MKNLYSFRGRHHLLGQVILATMYLWLVLFLLDEASLTQLAWAAGAGSLASSTYIVFATPRSISARPMNIFGGYLVALIIGMFFHQINIVFSLAMPDQASFVFECVTAFSIGITMLCMLLFHCGHPPAAGLTVVLVIERMAPSSVAVIIFAVAVLLFLRLWFKDYLT